MGFNKMAEGFRTVHMPPKSYKAIQETLAGRVEAAKQANEERAATLTRKREELKQRTLTYIKEYHDEDKKLVDLRRQAMLDGNYFLEPEPKLIFIIRIMGINKIPPKPRKIMQLFRLRQLHNGVFLRVTQPIMNMVKFIEPYVTFGYPTLKTVRNLIYKRGYGKINRARQRLCSNEMISENIGELTGCHGIEDIIHEIYTVGPHFRDVNNFLWPFKLNPPTGGFKCKRHGFAEAKGGDWGNRQEFMNKLLERMI